jgi:hypothetical protein
MDEADRELIEATARGVERLLFLAIWGTEDVYEADNAMRRLRDLLSDMDAARRAVNDETVV